ncbi:family 16 glycosylhydrolase [uncultured Sphingomonas sp.]|uniref:family 16 glycosylhydrolase n=1 Tax=uncultured Sphingomonas sp. TaxID=158754 RepID=UPI0035CB86EF
MRTSSAMVTVALLLAGCGGGSEGAAPGINIVPGAVAVAPVPAAAPAPAPETAQGSPEDLEALRYIKRGAASLPPLDLSDMRLWNWGGKWHASEWGNWMGPLPWKYDHVSKAANGDVVMKLDSGGAPQLQAMDGMPPVATGMWETEVTLPKLKDGLVVAPLWLYDAQSSDEIDFEFAGRKGLDVTMHVKVNGQMQHMSSRLFAGRDMSGERHRFGIKVDQTNGYVEMYLDGYRVHRWDRSTSKGFVSRTLRPFIEMWAANPDDGGFVGWVGRWTGLADKETLTMTVHGYGYNPTGKTPI